MDKSSKRWPIGFVATLIKPVLFFLTAAAVISSTGAISAKAQGIVGFSVGLSISPNPVYLSQPVTFSFTLEEYGGQSIYFSDIVVEIQDSSGFHAHNFKWYNDVYFTANEEIEFNPVEMLPTELPQATYEVVVKGKELGNDNWILFEGIGGVLNWANLNVCREKSLSIDPVEGPPGTVFTISGQGFPANDNAVIHFWAPDYSEYETVGITVDAQGGFVYEHIFPEYLDPDDYWATVSDDVWEQTQFCQIPVVDFVVTEDFPPPTLISPANGAEIDTPSFQFEWFHPSASEYELLIRDPHDDSFSGGDPHENMISSGRLSQSSYLFNFEEQEFWPDVYDWYVIAYKDGLSVESEWREFTLLWEPEPPSFDHFRVWIDKNADGVYNDGEGVPGAEIWVDHETDARAESNDDGLVTLTGIENETKLYAYKLYYTFQHPRGGDDEFGGREFNPFFATGTTGSADGILYYFGMAGDILLETGEYIDFPRYDMDSAERDENDNILIELVHPKIEWNLTVAFEEAQSNRYYEDLKKGIRRAAEYVYDYTDGYATLRNVVFIKGRYYNSRQWTRCDLQISNIDWPRAHVFGPFYPFYLTGTRMYFGKKWEADQTEVSPTNLFWGSTLAHEMGHYYFGFLDEYNNANGDDHWSFRYNNDGDPPTEQNLFPKNYGVMQSQYGIIGQSSELSASGDYTHFETLGYGSINDIAPAQYLNKMPHEAYNGQMYSSNDFMYMSCWDYFSKFFRDRIKDEMFGSNGFHSLDFFDNLLIPPHRHCTYPSDCPKRWRSDLRHNNLRFIDWWYPGTGPNLRARKFIFDAKIRVTDTTGKPVPWADVWVVSGDQKSPRGKTNRAGVCDVASLRVGKSVEIRHEGREHLVSIAEKRSLYEIVFPRAANRQQILRSNGTAAGIAVYASIDSMDPTYLRLEVSGVGITGPPGVEMKQAPDVTLPVPMSGGGGDYSGSVPFIYHNGYFEIEVPTSSGTISAICPFRISDSQPAPSPGFQTPFSGAEVRPQSEDFAQGSALVLLENPGPAPDNGNLVQIGNAVSLGVRWVPSFSTRCILHFPLPVERTEGLDKNGIRLYGWNFALRGWEMIDGGVVDHESFQIPIDGVSYKTYALFGPVSPDTENPSAPDDFSGQTGDSRWRVLLSWTAPHDNEGVFAYDIRYNTSRISAGNWNNAVSAGGGSDPFSAGAPQAFIVEMPDPDTEYWFGIRAYDAAGNASPPVITSRPIRSHVVDEDADGLPDAWESAHHLGFFGEDDADPDEDYDGDTLTNLEEYTYKTNPRDRDTDNDGFTDAEEIAAGTDPNSHTSNPPPDADADADGDGVRDTADNCPYEANPGQDDRDGDGIGDACDAVDNRDDDDDDDNDSDGDSIDDYIDNCRWDYNPSQSDIDGDGRGDACDSVDDRDDDGDGTPNTSDQCPENPGKTEPGVCGCDAADTDTDGDGTLDCNDQCPNDPAKTAPGGCGCGVADTDTDDNGVLDCNQAYPPEEDADSDGVPNASDQCPADPGKTAPGVCGCGVADTDTDLDGASDCIDACPADPGKTQPGVCGCGVSDIDANGNGIPDCTEDASANRPPAAVIDAPAEMDEKTTVTVSGVNSTDPDMNIASYHWMQIDGMAGTFDDADAAETGYTAPNVGEDGGHVTIQLTVKDEQGVESSTTRRIRVRNHGPGEKTTSTCFIDSLF